MGRDSSSASTVGDHSDFINLVDVSTNTTAKHFWISFRSWSSDADVATNYSILLDIAILGGSCGGFHPHSSHYLVGRFLP